MRYLPEVLNSWSSTLNHFHMLSSVYWQFYTSFLEKAMAPHSSTLAWKIPWMEEPGRLQSMGSLSWTQLSDFTFTFHFHTLQKEIATHSSVLAWRIPGTVEPGGLSSLGLHRVKHDWNDLAVAYLLPVHYQINSRLHKNGIKNRMFKVVLD